MIWLPLKARLKRIFHRLIRSRTSKKILSPSGIAAWSDFYIQEQNEDNPSRASFSLKKFIQLVQKHGFPDVGNPWPEGDEQFYKIHPGGFLAGEVERVLIPAQNDAEEQARQAALDRIGWLCFMHCPFISVTEYWAKEDVQLAMTLALSEGSWEKEGGFGAEGIVWAQSMDLIQAAVAPGLLMMRHHFEMERYPSWWVRWKRHRERQKIKKIAVPRLDIRQWREKRQQALPEPSTTPPTPPSD